jgi:hypothetical protein
MMSLWDALRMNMMISYQELVRTFLNQYRVTACRSFITGLHFLPVAIFSPGDGWFEPVVEIGDEVQAGDLAGWLHRLSEPEAIPQAIHFKVKGRVYSQRTLVLRLRATVLRFWYKTCRIRNAHESGYHPVGLSGFSGSSTTVVRKTPLVETAPGSPCRELSSD